MALANTLYDEYLGLRGQVFYTATPEIEYPDNTQSTVLGTVYAPRVYGRDLTSFEVASSGVVAVTLNDVHSLDIVRDDEGSNVSFVTLCNDSLTFNVQNNNIFVKMDAESSNLNMYASSDINITAGNQINLNTDTMSLEMGKTFSVHAGEDVILDAFRNVQLTAETGFFDLSAKDSNVTIRAGVVENDLELYAQRDIIVTASNDMKVSVANEIQVVTPTLSNIVDFSSTSVTQESILIVDDGIKSSGITIVPGTTTVTSSDMFTLDITGDGGAYFEMSNATVKLTSSNTIIDTDTSSTVVATESKLTVGTGATLSTFDVTPGNVITTATSNNTIRVDDGLLISEIAMVPGTLTATATDHILVTVQGASLDVAGGDVTLTSSNNIIMETLGQNFKMYTDVYGARTVSTTKMFSLTTDDMVDVYSSNMTKLVSKNQTDIVSDTSSVVLSAKNSNVQLQLGLDGTDAKLTSTGEVSLNAGATTQVIAINGDVAHSIVMDTTTNKITTSTTGIHEFVVDEAKIMTIDNSNVHIDGNLRVSGVIDSYSVTETNLQIQDKTVTLAFSSNNDDFGTLEDDGVANDQAGIVVAGKPAGLLDLTAASNYEKSIRWNYGATGTFDLGTSNIEKEAFWEFKGGSIRLTHTKTKEDGSFDKVISFGFRINHLDELELVKKYYSPSESNYVFKRVAKFGSMMNTL